MFQVILVSEWYELPWNDTTSNEKLFNWVVQVLHLFDMKQLGGLIAIITKYRTIIYLVSKQKYKVLCIGLHRRKKKGKFSVSYKFRWE